MTDFRISLFCGILVCGCTNATSIVETQVLQAKTEINSLCSTKREGAQEWRDRFAASRAALGSQCQKEKQSRECRKGEWTTWSGSFVNSSCELEKYYVFFATTKEKCQSEIAKKLGFKTTWLTCDIGGACGDSCGKPSDVCRSAHPQKWGACFDNSDLAMQ